MVPTSKCSDVGDHICAVVYTTSYVRQIWVGAVYYTARTYIGHDDWSSAQLWQSLSYIRGGITEIGYFASWERTIVQTAVVQMRNRTMWLSPQINDLVAEDYFRELQTDVHG